MYVVYACIPKPCASLRAVLYFRHAADPEKWHTLCRCGFLWLFAARCGLLRLAMALNGCM